MVASYYHVYLRQARALPILDMKACLLSLSLKFLQE